MTETHLIDTARLQRTEDFNLVPDADQRAAMAETFGIRGIKKLRFAGKIGPDGARDLRLDASLGATVVQDCVVTGEPVTTRIEEDITRRYLADMETPTGDEVEMPEDDTAEHLPNELDVVQVMSEALALALPPWPRAPGVDPVDITVTEPGIAPMTDEDAKPFAALKDLKAKLQNDNDPS